MSELHYRTCNLCEAMCGLEIEHRDGEVLSIRGDQADPFSRGHICPKAVALQDLHSDPDRLRMPVRRTAGGWQEISWEEAFEETARRLSETRQQYGRNAVGIYAGNPTAHNHGALLMLVPFLKALGTRNRYSATSVDQLPHMLACLEMFGHQALFPVPDIDHTDHFLVIGANPMASNGSVMTAPDMRQRLKDIRGRGGKLVVVDPRRTETAKVADEHHFIRPGNDSYLLLGMLNVVFREGLVAPGRLENLLDGLETMRDVVAGWSPKRVASLTGMQAAEIERLAREFAGAASASAYCRVGTTTAAHGTLSAWLVYVLNIVTGNLDRPGGLMFTRPAMDVVALAGMTGDTGGFDRYRSRVRGLPEFSGEFPAVTLADEILTPGEGQIRAMVTHAGNPVLSCPNGRHLDEAFAQLDFMVSIDLYINETTRHADIILPPTGHLEHAQFDPVFHALAIRNTIKFSPALFEPQPDAMHDWQLLLELITRLNSRDRRSTLQARMVRALVLRLGDTGIVDLALRLGPYGAWPKGLAKIDRLIGRVPGIGRVGKRLWQQLRSRIAAQPLPETPGDGLTLRRVLDAPHGIDLGPLRPALPERLFTADKRIRLAPARFLEQLALLADAPVAESDRLLMIGRRHVRSNNSWMHNSRRLVKGKSRCDVMIHPEDAARFGISEGELVCVKGDAGAIELPAKLSEDIMPGVISVPHGWGHAREGVKLSVASAHAGESVNDVIDDRLFDPFTGMAILNGVPVQVSRVA